MAYANDIPYDPLYCAPGSAGDDYPQFGPHKPKELAIVDVHAERAQRARDAQTATFFERVASWLRTEQRRERREQLRAAYSVPAPRRRNDTPPRVRELSGHERDVYEDRLAAEAAAASAAAAADSLPPLAELKRLVRHEERELGVTTTQRDFYDGWVKLVIGALAILAVLLFVVLIFSIYEL